MNKKIIIILLLIIPIFEVKADMIRKYKYYEIIREDGPYSLKETEEYPLIDYNNYIYTDYIETEEIPEQMEGRIIEKTTYYTYKRTKNISYIKLQNKSEGFNISNIEITYDGNPLNYTCEFINSTPSQINTNGYIIFNFEEEIDQTKIKLKISADTGRANIVIITGDKNCEQTRYTTTLTHSLEWEGTNATYYSYSDWVIATYPYKLNSSRIVINKGMTEKYIYKDKLYKTYREYKNYSKDYLLNPQNPYTIKDEKNYIDEKVNESSKKKRTDIIEKNLIHEIIEVPNTGI